MNNSIPRIWLFYLGNQNEMFYGKQYSMSPSKQILQSFVLIGSCSIVYCTTFHCYFSSKATKSFRHSFKRHINLRWCYSRQSQDFRVFKNQPLCHFNVSRTRFWNSSLFRKNIKIYRICLLIIITQQSFSIATSYNGTFVLPSFLPFYWNFQDLICCINSPRL